jgi:hypothetical protein
MQLPVSWETRASWLPRLMEPLLCECESRCLVWKVPLFTPSAFGMQIVFVTIMLAKTHFKICWSNLYGSLIPHYAYHFVACRPVQENLRWNCDRKKADEICNFNRHYAEHSGYYEKTDFKGEARAAKDPMEFYDSNTGKLLFTAPAVGRTMDKFLAESAAHGWPSFRDAEVR